MFVYINIDIYKTINVHVFSKNVDTFQSISNAH